jgi:hypothetical protein
VLRLFNIMFYCYASDPKKSFSTTLVLCLWYFNSFYSAICLLGGSSIPHLNTVESPWAYVACFLNLSFDVLSMICRLYNLCSPFTIPFILFRPLFSRLGHTHVFTWEPYAAFHGMALTCHIEGSMITAIWTHSRMFLNSKLYQFILNVEFCLSRC